MGNDVVFDAAVDLAGDHSVFQQIGLGAVGTKANNPPGPAWRHAGDLEQFLERGVVDVNAQCGRRSILRGLGQAAAVAVLGLAQAAKAETGQQKNFQQIAKAAAHASILRRKKRSSKKNRDARAPRR